MEHHDFTDEECRELRANPYTRSCTGHTLKFTYEFNELFMAKHSQGIGPSAIFKECGYRLELLGHRRVENYYARMKNTVQFSNYKENDCSGKIPVQIQTDISLKEYASMPPLQAISAMQKEILYLRQELDFLKKTVALANKK